ncbi:hypothetical protein FPV67DRAFT_423282 [Lyophyllum atratum]|nr:hypothetical protein FPV67DRAFT_423282 [Lyophyllum atratum]
MPPAFPRSIVFLTCFSLFLATAILVLSLLNLGRLSLWMDPAFAICTLVYHTSLLVLVYVRPQKASMFLVPSIACAYLLAVAWLASFSVMAILGCGRHAHLQFSGIVIFATPDDSYPITLHTFECILVPCESIIICSLAVRLTLHRRTAKAFLEDLNKRPHHADADITSSSSEPSHQEPWIRVSACATCERRQGTSDAVLELKHVI